MASWRTSIPGGATALHEGWLAGCNAIAPDGPNEGALVRCFLLTDGLANKGLTDVEQIASQAAGVRENAGIGTSTFGIGADYNEALLGPMAAASSITSVARTKSRAPSWVSSAR